MTTHYVDLKVVPDAETGVAPLIGALYDQFHRVLVKHRLDSIGISFPHYSVIPRTLGDTIRLHGSEAGLQGLMSSDWMCGVRDHVRYLSIASAPGDAMYRVVCRRQFKSNIERLRRRRMKRKGESAEQAKRALPDSAAEKPNLPYVLLRSLSTGQPFCLFISLGQLRAAPEPGRFNSYGLGEGATVPWF